MEIQVVRAAPKEKVGGPVNDGNQGSLSRKKEEENTPMTGGGEGFHAVRFS